jgi:circadian clock protein KaiB
MRTDWGKATANRGRRDSIYVLRLYITGASRNSTRAVMNIDSICRDHLRGRHVLEVVDLYKQPERAAEEQLVAAPTLVKLLPLPRRRLIGNLSNLRNVLDALGLSPEGA